MAMGNPNFEIFKIIYERISDINVIREYLNDFKGDNVHKFMDTYVKSNLTYWDMASIYFWQSKDLNFGLILFFMSLIYFYS